VSTVKNLTATITQFARPRSHVPVFDRKADCTTWNFKTSPVLTGRSNDAVRCDQAVVHAQCSAVGRTAITALLLCRQRKRRRERLLWVHPIIEKREEFGACYTIRCLLHNV